MYAIRSYYELPGLPAVPGRQPMAGANHQRADSGREDRQENDIDERFVLIELSGFLEHRHAHPGDAGQDLDRNGVCDAAGEPELDAGYDVRQGGRQRDPEPDRITSYNVCYTKLLR